MGLLALQAVILVNTCQILSMGVQSSTKLMLHVSMCACTRVLMCVFAHTRAQNLWPLRQ